MHTNIQRRIDKLRHGETSLTQALERRLGRTELGRATLKLRPARRGPETLQELAVQHGSDKARGGKNFCAIYESYVNPLRGEPLTVLEIGVLDGASLRMWRDYFPRARVFGIDVTPSAKQHEAERIHIMIGDQGDTGFLDRVLETTGPPDFVLDDGSHLREHQIGSLVHLWPRLRRRGLYIVEDVHTSYLEKYGMAWREPGTT